MSVPGSKSLTNRALVLAAMAEGRSVLHGALQSEDSEVCAAALRVLGVAVERDASGTRITVDGAGGGPPEPRADVDVRLSGTAARFLCPYLALGRGQYRVDGVPRMRQRPMAAVVDALRSQGVRVDGGPGLPLTIHGTGALAGGEIEVAADDTSQAASGLLMAAPYARRDVVLRPHTGRAALPYVAMTAAVMADFGADVRGLPTGDYLVRAGVRYRAREYAVEPDASSAAYFWAAAALTGGSIRTPGVGRSALQGDAALLGVLEAMGCRVEGDGGGVRVTGPRDGRLRGGAFDLGTFSDQALTVAALALFADGPTTVTGVRHIRLQESDRVAAAAAEVGRLGGRCEERDDGFVVWPLRDGGGAPVVVQTHGDHRVAMSFALVGLRRPGVAIADPGVVAKTFPGFFAELERICPAEAGPGATDAGGGGRGG